MLLPMLALVAAAQMPASPKPIDAAGWIKPDDYPKSDLRAGISGAVGYRLDLTKAGAVRRCTVTSSSGDHLLDDTTCRILRARAQFAPPIDGSGKSIASSYSGTVRWTLPTLPVAPIPPVPAISLTASLRRSPVPFNAAYSSGAFGRGAVTKFRVPSIAIDPIARPVHVADTETPPIDPAVRTGQLPNGLRYMVMRNALPLGAMSMRMRVAAGPIDETEAQRGYAHLVEHMTFRGTTNVPDGQLVKSLEQMGLALGADTTANTTPEETVFGLDFPPARSSALLAGLFLLREVASRATFAPAAVAAERGVVLSEERLRDSPAARAEWARTAFLLEGQRMANRAPIGTIGTISNATAIALKAFYDEHYRPDRTTLIVVGDASPDEIENSIKASFGDWAANNPPPDPQDLGGVRPRAQQIRIVAEPGMPERAEIDWVSAYDASPDTLARERQDITEQIACMILADRLVRLSQAPAAPFVQASVQRSSLFHSARIASLSVLAPGQPSTTALAAAMVEQRRIVRFGVTRAELDRVTTRIRNLLAQAVDTSVSRASAALANELLTSVVTGTSFTTPVQAQADFDQIVARLSVADVAAAATHLFSGSGPLVFVAAPKTLPDAEGALRTALSQAEAQPPQPAPAIMAKPWAYSSFGPGGTVEDRQEVADLGVTMVRFRNGTSVAVKASRLPKDQIVVAANFGSGLSGLPKQLEASYWALSSASQLYINGGLGKAAALDIRDQIDGKVAGAQFVTTDDRFVILGRTRRKDLDLQLELITAYLVDPAFRDSAWKQARAVVGSATVEVDASASLTADRYRPLLLHDGDRRWSMLPTTADLSGSRPADMAAMLGPSLAGPIDLVIVGDVDVDRAIEAARLTIGALPARGPRPAPRDMRFPKATRDPVPITTHARPDQGVAMAAWPTSGFYANTIDSRAIQVLARVIDARLTDGLREKDGLTYTPLVIVDQSQTFASYGALIAQVEISPAKADRFFAALDAITSDLAATPISREELDRARVPALDQTRAAAATPDYWVAELTLAGADSRQFDTIRSRLPELAAVTPADIRRLAKTFLAGKPPFRAIVESVAAKVAAR